MSGPHLTHPMNNRPLRRPRCTQILDHGQLAGLSGSCSESQSTMKSSGLCFSNLSSDPRCGSDCDCHLASRARCDAALAARTSRHSLPQSAAFSSSRLKDLSTNVVKRRRLFIDTPSADMRDHRALGGNLGGVLGEDGVLDEFLFIVKEEAELRPDLIRLGL